MKRSVPKWVLVLLTSSGLGLWPWLGSTLADTSSPSPTVTVANDRTTLHLAWPNGDGQSIDVQSWQVNLLDSFDCLTYSQVPERSLHARRILGQPIVDARTGNIAVAVLLEECVEVQKSAVFVVDPQGSGAYALYRVQVPGDRPLPNEFSTYALSSVDSLHYWDSTLLVRHGDASGAMALVIFRPTGTPAGAYAGCAVLQPGEGAGSLCPNDPSLWGWASP